MMMNYVYLGLMGVGMMIMNYLYLGLMGVGDDDELGIYWFVVYGIVMWWLKHTCCT